MGYSQVPPQDLLMPDAACHAPASAPLPLSPLLPFPIQRVKEEEQWSNWEDKDGAGTYLAPEATASVGP